MSSNINSKSSKEISAIADQYWDDCQNIRGLMQGIIKEALNYIAEFNDFSQFSNSICHKIENRYVSALLNIDINFIDIMIFRKNIYASNRLNRRLSSTNWRGYSKIFEVNSKIAEWNNDLLKLARKHSLLTKKSIELSSRAFILCAYGKEFAKQIYPKK